MKPPHSHPKPIGRGHQMDQDEIDAGNEQFLAEALKEFASDLRTAIDSNPKVFLNAHLEITVQNGIMKTAKPGITKCRHATAG